MAPSAGFEGAGAEWKDLKAKANLKPIKSQRSKSKRSHSEGQR